MIRDMELNTVKTITTWNDAAEAINANTQKIGNEIEKLKVATYKNKGYFSTEDALVAAYPTASAGSKAYVGSSYPYTIYAWDTDMSAWVSTGDSGGDESVDLGNYYTKEETHEAIRSEYEVLTLAEYESLETKEDKLYFCYEE